jgi:hypothetical protein
VASILGQDYEVILAGFQHLQFDLSAGLTNTQIGLLCAHFGYVLKRRLKIDVDEFTGLVLLTTPTDNHVVASWAGRWWDPQDGILWVPEAYLSYYPKCKPKGGWEIHNAVKGVV